MTLYPETTYQPPLAQPVSPADKARAAELYAQVKDTAAEAKYREISTRHPHKNDSAAQYQAFLREIEHQFAAPPVPQDSREQDDLGHADHDPAPGFDLDRHPDVGLPVEEAGEDDPEGDEGSEDEPDADEVIPDSPAVLVTAAGVAQEATTPPAPVLTAPPTDAGLISQLAGMLGEGEQLSFTLVKLGADLTIKISRQGVAGESVPLIVTGTPAYFDAHLIPAMQPYAQAQRDAYAAAAEAALQQASASKAAAKKGEAKPGKASASKTYTVTLQAAEGTDLTAILNGKDVPLTVGENTGLGSGNLMITAAHPLFGEVKKTLAVYGDKSHDLRDQQGGRLTVQVTPESAALTARKGETTLALHGETLLPSGTWDVTAEADGFETASVKVKVQAGKAQVVPLDLKARALDSLF